MKKYPQYIRDMANGICESIVNETFFTKTYIENSIMLQEFIVTLNTINNIISELQIEFKDENKKSKK